VFLFPLKLTASQEVKTEAQTSELDLGNLRKQRVVTYHIFAKHLVTEVFIKGYESGPVNGTFTTWCVAHGKLSHSQFHVGNVRHSTFRTYQHLTGRGPHAMSFSSWAFQHPCRSQANPSRSELVAFILSEVVGVIRVFQIQQTALCESLKDNNQICTWISGYKWIE